MQIDGGNSTTHLALKHIAKTITSLRDDISRLNITGNEQVDLALYLMEMTLAAVDASQSDEIYGHDILE